MLQCYEFCNSENNSSAAGVGNSAVVSISDICNILCF